MTATFKALLALLIAALLITGAQPTLAATAKGNITTPGTTVPAVTAEQPAGLITADDGSLAVQVTGSWSGGSLTVEAQVTTSSASANWTPLTVCDQASVPKATITANGLYRINAAGIRRVRVQSAAGVTGTAVVEIFTAKAAGPICQQTVTANIVPTGQTGAASALSVVLPNDATFSTAMESNLMSAGGVAITPKFALISAAGSGNNTVVSAVTSPDKKIRVLQYCFVTDAAVDAKFQSGASGTDLTGLMKWDAVTKGMCPPFSPVGLFETAAGALLNLNLSTNVGLRGFLAYVEIP